MRSGFRTNSSDTMKPPDTNSSLYVWFFTSSRESTPAKLTEGSFFRDTRAGICSETSHVHFQNHPKINFTTLDCNAIVMDVCSRSFIVCLRLGASIAANTEIKTGSGRQAAWGEATEPCAHVKRCPRSWWWWGACPNFHCFLETSAGCTRCCRDFSSTPLRETGETSC